MKKPSRNEMIQSIKNLMQGKTNLQALSDAEQEEQFQVTLHLGPGNNPDGSHPTPQQWKVWQEEVRRTAPAGSMLVTLNL